MASEKENIVQHFKSYFEGHDFELMTWDTGPIKDIIPEFEVIKFSPGKKCDQWVYCSVGTSKINNETAGRYEFIVISPIETERMVQMLAMVTYFHSQHGLEYTATVPIGEPWLEGSVCENWLVSLPFPFDQSIEIIPDCHARVGWLLAISDAEREFIAEHGLEALEQRFDDVELKHWKIDRVSVV
jgi:suppressor of fused protein SUFU